MSVVLTVTAAIGLLIFIVGAVLWFMARPRNATVMVIGGLVFAVATVITLLDTVL